MKWEIKRGKYNSYMTSDLYMSYHNASIHRDRLVSLQAPNGDEYVESIDLSGYKYIELPKLENIKYDDYMDLFKVLKNRRSRRNFSKDHYINFKDFAKFIQYSMGKSYINQYNMALRTYPSGGARYPVEVYIITQNIENLKDLNIYRLNAEEDRLYDMNKKITREELKNLTCASKYEYNDFMSCNIYIFLTSSFKKTTCKYGLLGYRLVLLEAGHIGQNISLVGERMGLSTLALGGFYEKKINEILNINHFNETTLYFFVVGGKK